MARFGRARPGSGCSCPGHGLSAAAAARCASGTSAYSRSTSAARCASTARWLIEPLSVTSPRSMRRRLGQHVQRAPRGWRCRCRRATGGRPAPGRRRAPRVVQHLAAAASSPAGRPARRHSSSAREDQQRRRRRGSGRRSPRPARRGRRPARSCARSGPTLTKVPVDSLKSSAMRPSNSRPRCGSAGSIELHRVAGAVEAFFVEGLGGLLGRAPVARHHVRAAEAHLELAVRPAPA